MQFNSTATSLLEKLKVNAQYFDDNTLLNQNSQDCKLATGTLNKNTILGPVETKCFRLFLKIHTDDDHKNNENAGKNFSFIMNSISHCNSECEVTQASQVLKIKDYDNFPNETGH